MTADNYHISKSTPPKIDGLVARPRVFELLDLARQSEIAWVSGSAGSGKTALVATYLEQRRLSYVWYKTDSGDADPATFFYCLRQAFQKFVPSSSDPLPILTPEYRQNLHTFAIRFFEQIASFPEAPKLIIIDDYHEIPAGAELHPVLAKAFSNLPKGISFVVISREYPPSRFARLRASGLLSVLNPESLKLSLEEAHGVMQTLLRDTSPELVTSFHEYTMGWAAGITLMAEHHRLTGGVGSTLPVRTPQEILDYFATELFEQTPAIFQDSLLKTSAFNEMTAQMARDLTGLDNCDELLVMLNRKHFFTEVYIDGEPVYRYHPLFLQFLRSRAVSTFGLAGFRSLQRDAAAIAEKYSLWDKAAELHAASGNWQGLTTLLDRMAVEVIAQGRTMQFIEWMEKVPPDLLALHPRLHYWMGVAELSLSHFATARSHFELAFSRSLQVGNGECAYLAWSSIIQTTFLEMHDWRRLDHWIAELVELQRRHPEIPCRETEFRVALSCFTAHVLRQVNRDEIKRWGQHLDTLLSCATITERLEAGLIKSVQLSWTGDYMHNRLLLGELREDVWRAKSPPVPVLTLCLLEALHSWLTVDADGCRAAATRGLALAESSGVSMWTLPYAFCLAQAALIEGEYGEARTLIRDMERKLRSASNVDRFHFHLLSALCDFLQHDVAAAFNHLELGREPTTTIGSPVYEGMWCLAMAQVTLARKSYDEALHFLDRASEIVALTESRNLQFLALLYRAQVLLELNSVEDALDALKEALSIGRDHNFLHYVWWVPSSIADLCATALRHGIETDYVCTLIRRRNLFPAVPPVDLEQWPWGVTIYCLGKFQVLAGGAAVKMQKKPLELLKVLIALGGSEVRYERIADLLWPDAEGDTGLGNFKITLHRLRQLLGENTFQFKDGKLSLDTHSVWVDVWAFERAALKASAEWSRESDSKVAVAYSERAVSLYRGQFFAEDQEQGDIYLLREKLSRTFVTLVSFIGNSYLGAGMFEQAIAVYQRGLEMEPLTEFLYEGLIKAYLVAGYRADAVQAYSRYETTLRKSLDLHPAARITQLISEYIT